MWETILTPEERAAFALRRLYLENGYATYRMSRFEEYDLYVRCRDFLPPGRIITFPGPDGRLLALKPDVTLSVLRGAPEGPGETQRVCYNEKVYRADPASGDFREIMQTGLECVGDLTEADVARVVELAMESLQTLGAGSILTLSHMGLLRSILEGSGLSAQGQREAMECFRRKNPHSLRALCAREGVDGALLPAMLTCTHLEDLTGDMAGSEAYDELARVYYRLVRMGCGDRLRLDFSVGQDMKYYDGLVFKGYLEGIPTSILSGGQYDRLARQLGKNCRAVGFAVYVELLRDIWTGGAR